MGGGGRASMLESLPGREFGRPPTAAHAPKGARLTFRWGASEATGDIEESAACIKKKNATKNKGPAKKRDNYDVGSSSVSSVTSRHNQRHNLACARAQ